MRSLTLKLTLAFLVVSLGGIALVAVLVWGNTTREFNTFLKDRGMNEYVNEVTQYYQTHQSWEGIENYLYEKRSAFQSDEQDPENTPPPSPFVLIDTEGKLLISLGMFKSGDAFPENQIEEKTAIQVNDKVVGYVLLTSRQPRPDPFESRFLFRMNRALILAALGASILAVLLGLFLARSVTRPVRELTAATSALSQGNLAHKVQVRSNDELGVLTQSFNKMSADLEHANNLRRQMTADIAHDLRSPLSVITGYLEGLKDGVVKPTPERFSTMYDEALFLQRLVEDLRTLSLADAGELSISLQRVQPAELIERLASAYQRPAEQKNVSIKTEIEQDLPEILVDPERMLQAMSNLIHNALSFTKAGDLITLSARREGNVVSIEVRDSGGGIEPEALPHVFERFYRVESSRQDGGSGLGLAIGKSIVELQGGTLQAASDGVGKGSSFTICIPVDLNS